MTNEIPKGRAKGGYARAACLSPDQRSAIASEAARIRWRNHRLPDVPRVLEGFKSELNLAGMTIPCAVISGPKGIQRVLTENGITYAILGLRTPRYRPNYQKRCIVGYGAPKSTILAFG